MVWTRREPETIHTSAESPEALAGASVTIPPKPVPPAVVTRPGDLILVRAISFWDSGQLKRVVFGIALAAAPVLYDLFQHDTLTWKTGVNALIAGVFAWMGYSRAKSPDVVTGSKALDAPATPIVAHAFVPAKLLADLQVREATKPGKGS